MLEVEHARQLLAEFNMPEAACQLDALLETAAAKDTICQWQMLLNGNAAQGAANPSPLRRRNGPPPLKGRIENPVAGKGGTVARPYGVFAGQPG